ncbi:hypothetical protein C8Q75DRAFT_286302 [Abortiporus biennis]|nr:hypothetical protein C8Q75DRAFT_286302 [Abortiporus biennis]
MAPVFHQTWWGTTHLQDKLRIESNPVLNVLEVPFDKRIHLLMETRGQLCVRNDYKLLYDRLVSLSQSGKKVGVILSGQPGIGKSYFNMFALLKRMSERKATLFTNFRGVTFLFHEEGIFRKPAVTVSLEDDIASMVVTN